MYYTGKTRSLALTNEPPANVLLYSGRPDLEEVVAEIVGGIETGAGLPEDMVEEAEQTRHRSASAAFGECLRDHSIVEDASPFAKLDAAIYRACLSAQQPRAIVEKIPASHEPLDAAARSRLLLDVVHVGDDAFDQYADVVPTAAALRERCAAVADSLSIDEDAEAPRKNSAFAAENPLRARFDDGDVELRQRGARLGAGASAGASDEGSVELQRRPAAAKRGSTSDLAQLAFDPRSKRASTAFMPRSRAVSETISPERMKNWMVFYCGGSAGRYRRRLSWFLKSILWRRSRSVRHPRDVGPRDVTSWPRRRRDPPPAAPPPRRRDPAVGSRSGGAQPVVEALTRATTTLGIKLKIEKFDW